MGVVLLQVVLIVLNVLFFMWTGPERSDVVWLSYVFATIAYLVFEAVVLVSRNYKWRAWNWNLIYISLLFFVSELIVGVVLASLTTNMVLAITIHLILLLGFMIWGYFLVSASTTSSLALKQQEQDAIYAKELALIIKNLGDEIEDVGVRKFIHKLYETLWCSPRASNSRAREYESQIASGVEELKLLIAEARWSEVCEKAKSLNILAQKRNTLL